MFAHELHRAVRWAEIRLNFRRSHSLWRGLQGTFRLSFLLVNLTPEKNSHQILFNRTGCICLKTGIVLITIVTLGCSEPGTCQDGWNIPKVLNWFPDTSYIPTFKGFNAGEYKHWGVKDIYLKSTAIFQNYDCDHGQNPNGPLIAAYQS